MIIHLRIHLLDELGGFQEMMCDDQYSAKPNHNFFIQKLLQFFCLTAEWETYSSKTQHTSSRCQAECDTAQWSSVPLSASSDLHSAALSSLYPDRCVWPYTYTPQPFHHSAPKDSWIDNRSPIQKHFWHNMDGASLSIKGTCIIKNAGLVRVM